MSTKNCRKHVFGPYHGGANIERDDPKRRTEDLGHIAGGRLARLEFLEQILVEGLVLAELAEKAACEQKQGEKCQTQHDREATSAVPQRSVR